MRQERPQKAKTSVQEAEHADYRTPLARTLRRETTESEAHLWPHLSGRRLGDCKFRRQRPLDRCIADFCCDDLKLIVELDGGYHAAPDQQERDTQRDALLTAHGYTILRFTNSQALTDTNAVLQTILLTIQTLKQQKAPSPLVGEGVGGEGASAAGRDQVG